MQKTITLCFLLLVFHSVSSNLEPVFDSDHELVTVRAGTKAVLPCTVKYLGEYMVIWVSPSNILISHEDRSYIDDPRISIDRPFNKEWNLLINNANYNDSGTYQCQINTEPVQIKEVSLSVLVPPNITSSTADNMKVREGETAELVCNVTGVPMPQVTWYKRNIRDKRKNREKIGIDGELLVIHNISRDFDDMYECLVDNGVPPALTKSTRVIVEFPPDVTIERPRIGQFVGRKTVLECSVHAYPQYIVVWKRRNKQITSNKKYTVEVDSNAETRVVTLRLIIHRVSPRNYGKYTCEAKNDLGQSSADAVLYEISPPSTTSTTTQLMPSTVSEKHATVLKDTQYFVSQEQPGLQLQPNNKPDRKNSTVNSIPTKSYPAKQDQSVSGPEQPKPVFGSDMNKRGAASTILLSLSLLLITVVFAQFAIS